MWRIFGFRGDGLSRMLLDNVGIEGFRRLVNLI